MNASPEFRYGSFDIQGRTARWRRSPEVAVELDQSRSQWCLFEGYWRASPQATQGPFRTALAGACIWSRYDCVVHFEPRGRGNPGAQRSLSSPLDRADVLRRLRRGHAVRHVHVTADPMGPYQRRLIGWQADSARLLQLERIYYSLPLDEYIHTLQDFEGLLPQRCLDEVLSILHAHHGALKSFILEALPCEVEFLRPMNLGARTPVESYLWPYQNLDLDLALEELEELRLCYEAAQRGADVPPVLVGVLDSISPYLQRRPPSEAPAHIILPE